MLLVLHGAKKNVGDFPIRAGQPVVHPERFTFDAPSRTALRTIHERMPSLGSEPAATRRVVLPTPHVLRAGRPGPVAAMRETIEQLPA
jgi:hypothetical protein